MSMQILVIHIGPVQEFIESARKCRDLWFGSWLLSELARAAAAAVVAAERREEADVLVFPGAKTNDHGRSVANKVIARIVRPAGEVAAEAEAAMRGRLQTIRDEAFGRLTARVRGESEAYFHRGVAEAQVDGAIEFLWAASPCSDDEAYVSAISEAERLLAAVKNTKSWGQPSWAKDGVPKSSLDGVRESVLDEALFEHPRDGRESAGGAAASLRERFGIHPSERLCGVGVLKRFGTVTRAGERPPAPGDDPSRIFSTSHVASGPFRAGLHKIGAAESWSRYLADLEAVDPRVVARMDIVPRDADDPVTGRVDGAVFYEGRVDEVLEELGFDRRRSCEPFDRARSALRAFLARGASKRIGEPLAYYAILLADGDRMGKAIAEQVDFASHRQLSEALESFASGARATVHDHDGALVYAGGDDVLALLPLHRALDCAAGLAEDFALALSPWSAAEDGERRAPTLSVGLAIVHHLMPLDEALALARRTEKHAKQVPGKDALAVVVKKRGGDAVVVEGRRAQLVERLRALAKLHRSGDVSSRAQYELMDVGARFKDAPDAAVGTVFAGIQAAEARRILTRKRASGGGDMADGVRAQLEQLHAYEDPAGLGRELYVAQLLAQALDQADPAEEAPRAAMQEANA